MFFFRQIILLIMIGFFLCDTVLGQVTRDEFIGFKNQIVHEINKQRVAYSEDIRRLREQRASLLEDYQSYTEIIQDLQNEISELKHRINRLEKENAVIKKNAEIRHQELLERIEAETRIRQQADAGVVKEVTSELSELSEMARKSTRAVSPPTSSSRIYVVEKGDTLGAIATAFQVKLGDLKAVNSLDNDMIYVGQKLKIPEP